MPTDRPRYSISTVCSSSPRIDAMLAVLAMRAKKQGAVDEWSRRGASLCDSFELAGLLRASVLFD